MEKTITRLQQLISEVPKKLIQFSPNEMAYKPMPNKWSKKEILGHLCDSALNNWQRFTYAQGQTGVLKIIPYLQAELVQANNYQNILTGNIAALWVTMNRQIITVLKNIQPKKYSLPVHFPNGEKKDLKWLVEDYLVHMEHHLNQVFNNKKIVSVLPINWNISVDDAMDKLAAHPEGKPFVTLLENGKMYIEIYKPRKVDLQTPHDQDEIYVVVSGSGIFYNNGERRSFQPGDLIFVPAGIEHRFEEFSDDFKTWVIFY